MHFCLIHHKKNRPIFDILYPTEKESMPPLFAMAPPLYQCSEPCDLFYNDTIFSTPQPAIRVNGVYLNRNSVTLPRSSKQRFRIHAMINL